MTATAIRSGVKPVGLDPATRFLESYDGSFFEDPATVEQSESQATLETVLSMLFGEAVVVPESYVTDSRGFLRAFELIRDARPNRLDPKNRLYEPFRLGHFRFPDPLEGLVVRLRRTTEIIGGERQPGHLHMSGFLPITITTVCRRRMVDGSGGRARWRGWRLARHSQSRVGSRSATVPPQCCETSLKGAPGR
ncbi:MAG: hypothetical protein Q8Q29_07840 [Actinomycetota bacterium]|nr:hypothetical protein [Actinomycetota bacterium]